MLFILLLLLLSAEDAARSQDINSKFEVTSVVEAIADNKESLQGLSVTTEWELRWPYPGDAAQLHTVNGTDTSLFETSLPNGRIRCEVKGANFVEGVQDSVTSVVALAVFDGDTAKSTTGETNYVSGRISNDRDTMPWRFDPRQAVAYFYGQSIDEHIEEYHGRIVGQASIDGIETLTIETTSIKTDAERRLRFHVAPELNFAVVRRAIEVKYPKYDVWLEYRRIQNGDYEEVSPGIWLPTKALSQEYIVSETDAAAAAASGQQPRLMRELRLKFSNWVVNPVMTDDLFDFEFADGVYVTNKITGANYQTAGINDLLIKHQAEEVRRFTEGAKTERSLFLYANLAVVVVLAVLFLKRTFGHRFSESH